MKTLILLMACPDRPGIVARVTSLFYEAGSNILSLEQHVEEGKYFFMRIEADVSGNRQAPGDLMDTLRALGHELAADLRFYDPDERQRAAVLVTKDGACLQELLAKQDAGQLTWDVRMVIGNHEDLRPLAENAGLTFHHVPADKPGYEQRMLELLAAEKVGLVVLARYMKILSSGFVAPYEERIINIHHGFLPAFKGAGPYRQAWERGVKIIGATAHYVTAELDDGPIIAQGVTAVTHQHSVQAMVETGRDIEKHVLADAVRAHLEHRILVHRNRTIVFQR